MTKTLVTFVLDRSGSMATCFDSTVEAFNAYIGGLNGDENLSFSLILFDTMGLDTLYKNAPISDVGKLDRSNYAPRGGTPLIDAAAKAIKATEKRVAELGDNPKVVICIQTDGEENSSTQFTWDQLNALIKEKTALGWQFNFMGVGIDAYKQSARMGLSAAQTMSYDIRSSEATADAFMANAINTRSYAAGAIGSTHYTAKQKADAGDMFADKDKVAAWNGLPPLSGGVATTPTGQNPVASTPIVDDIDLSS